jgi:predicted phage gp36 major capsid-like protein
MAKKSRMGVLKRQRELKKKEKADLKRERKMGREAQETLDASPEDLEDYGFGPQGEDSAQGER